MLPILMTIPAFADTSTSQGYEAKENYARGTSVSVDKTNNKLVEAINVDNRKRLIGVVVGSQDTTLAFGGGENSVQVVSSGIVPALVSDINGDVKAGDELSVSPIDGTLMRASSKGKIIGTANEDFADADESKKVDVTDVNNKKQQVKVALLSVQVNIQDWSPSGVKENAFLESAREFISNVAGKPVSNVQAFSALAIVILALLISSVILYSSVSSSVISIGRNPLSKGIVRRNLYYMIALIALIIAGSGFAVYLILEG